MVKQHTGLEQPAGHGDQDRPNVGLSTASLTAEEVLAFELRDQAFEAPSKRVAMRKTKKR